SLLLILALVLLRPRKYWDTPHRVFAAAAALVAWLLLFSPIFWEHYHAYLAPLWGWVAFEATRSRAKMFVAIAVILLAMYPRVPAPLLNHLMWSTVLLLGLALARLMERADHEPVAEK